MFLNLAYRSFEFEGVDGNIHAFSGCSLAGKFEFDRRLGEIQQYLAEVGGEASPEQLYKADRKFSWLVDRCLLLNQIQPAWVNWLIAEQLLFYRLEDGEVRQGHLIEINNLPSSGRGEQVALTQLVAAISASIGGLEQALQAIDQVPAGAMLEILEAQAEIRKSPEEKQEDKYQDWKAKKVAQFEAKRQQTVS